MTNRLEQVRLAGRRRLPLGAAAHVRVDTLLVPAEPAILWSSYLWHSCLGIIIGILTIFRLRSLNTFMWWRQHALCGMWQSSCATGTVCERNRTLRLSR